MTKEKYMALDDLQTVWTNSMKPWIVGTFIAVTAVAEGATPKLVLQDGTLLDQSTFQSAGSYVLASEKGTNNGVATLDANGKVPSSQLPSFVDDVLEGYLNATDGKFYEENAYTTEIPAEGGKIYIDLSDNQTYRWGGTTYVPIAAGLALGETQGTAYEGSKGKALKDAYDLHVADTDIHVTASDKAVWNAKAEKVSNATAGNLAGLDVNGNPTDSGRKAADFATAAQGTKADSAIQSVKVNGTALTPDGNNAVDVTFEIPERVTAEELAAFVA